MTRPSRGIVRTVGSQWRFASSSARNSRQPPRVPPAKQPLRPVTRPYKPRTPRPPSSLPSPPPHPPDTVLSLWRRSWIPLSGAALVAGFLGFYIFGTAAASFKACPCQGPCEHATPTGRPPALAGDNAERFDKELDSSERWMGIASLRRQVAQQARGRVLEVAIGTGRNLEYYNWEPLSAAARGRKPAVVAPQGITSFTGLDISVDMLEVARKRLTKIAPQISSSPVTAKTSAAAGHTGGQLSLLDSRLRLVNSDTHHRLPPPAATSPPGPPGTILEAKYDTIIQTFGLCSVSNPVAVLSNLASSLEPGTGRIILLEHGKGWFGVVNGMLDRFAAKHFEKYGCWWNKDIEALVDEAVQTTPGLEVVKLDRPNIWQLGTLVRIELRVTTRHSSDVHGYLQRPLRTEHANRLE